MGFRAHSDSARSLSESVADYLVHYVDPNKPAVLEKPLKAALPELLNDWDKEFVYKKLYKNGNEKEHGLLFATLMAANFLGIEPLRDLCCAAIANMLRGKTPEQIMEECRCTHGWYMRLDGTTPPPQSGFSQTN